MIAQFDPWPISSIVVIDFETTGPDPETCEPVQVAAVRFYEGKEVGVFESLICPEGPIPAEATAIHGITDEDVAGARSAEDVLADDALAAICAGAVPCAYNAPFDRRILHRHAVPSDIPAFDEYWPWIDPLVCIREIDRFVKGKGRQKLGPSCARHGVALEDAHDATADARATGLLLWALRDQMSPHWVPAQLLVQQERTRAEQDKRFQAWLAKQPPKNATPGA